MEISPTLIVVLVIVFYVFSSIQILAEYERGVIFRLGKLLPQPKVGAIADILDRLGAAKINVTAIDAVTDEGRYGAIFWVAAKDVQKSAALLGAR